ncbi:AzlD domain-containing protein [Paenibacillus polymyxa]
MAFFSGNHGSPELISIITIILLRYWKRDMLFSIASGTLLYMLLGQFIF